MLNLILKKLRLIAKRRNAGGCKSMSKDKLNLITTDKLSFTPMSAFKMEEYIAKLTK